MTNYALDEENRIVAAFDALFNKKYRCLECSHPLRVRKGMRQTYFSHPSSSSCRLFKRTSDHLTVQRLLQESNPALEREKPFPDLGRIADLVWEEKRLIFEIQCSPISLEEAKERVRDYGLKGYSVFWLLDDRLYNKRKSSPTEKYLLESGSFFSLKRRILYGRKTPPLLPPERKPYSILKKSFYIILEFLLRSIAKK